MPHTRLEPDYRRLFESAPGLFLVLLPDAPRFTIVGASDAYLAATMTERAAIVGRGLFEVFPDNPHDAEPTAMRNLLASLDRVLATREPDTMAVQKYDIRKPDGAFEERHWSPTNAPVIAEDGTVSHVIHRVEDVTDLARLTAGQTESTRRVAQMEHELFVRARELERLNQRLRAANERLAADSESQLHALLDLLPELGWTARADGHIDFYNRGWYAYTGTSFAELQGWGWTRVHDPNLLPQVEARWKQSLATGAPFEMEFPLRRHDGVFRWFLTRVAPVRASDGKIVRWVGINTDIDDRRRAGKETEARLQLLIDSIRDYAVFMIDPQGTVATWSPGAERIKQWRAEEIIGKHFSIFYGQEDRAAGKPEHELAVAGATGRFEAEGWRYRKDGSRFWANVVVSAVRDADDRLLGFSKVTRDLTERKRAEAERLRLTEEEESRKASEAEKERFRFLAEASAILGSSLEYETTLQALARLVVPRYADWCSVAVLEGEAIDTVAVAHIDPAKVELARELQRRWPPPLDGPTGVPSVIRTGRAELYEDLSDDVLRLATVDEEHYLAARALDLRSALVVPLVARGNAIGALSLVWAESKRRYGAAELPLMEELGRRAGIAVDNARLHREVQRAVRLRDEFLSIASHELKTPLTTVVLQVGGVQRILRAPAEKVDVSKLAQRVDTIDRMLERLTSLVEDLLDVARASAGQIHLDLALVDLDEVVAEAADSLRPNLVAAGCALDVEAGGPLVGTWDRARLDQVVTNLLTNALKYGAGKPIRIVTSQRDGQAVLVVSDQGIGIAKADHARIFERFGRAAPAENYGGLGLGLWIVKELVEAMRGTIRVESALGEGARFIVTLPL